MPRYMRELGASFGVNKTPGSFAETQEKGLACPHIGRDSIWPMSQIIYALTSNSSTQVNKALQTLTSVRRRYWIHA